MTFFNAFSGVLTIFLVGMVGYLLARRGLVPPETVAAMPRFLTVIVLPPFLLRTVITTFGRDQLVHLVYGAAVPLLSMLIVFCAAILFGRMLGVREGRRGTFRAAMATSNTMNIGVPVNLALFGEAALPYVLLYFFANTTFFWTFANYSLAQDGEGPKPRLASLHTVRQILSPPFIGFICGLLLVLADVRLPAFLDKTFLYVGNMTIALGLIYIGILLNDIKRKDCKLEKDVLCVLFGRFILSPLVIILLAALIDIPPLMRNVFIIQSSLPVMMNVVIIAGHYRADVQFATVTISISTILSLITIPLYMILITSFL